MNEGAYRELCIGCDGTNDSLKNCISCVWQASIKTAKLGGFTLPFTVAFPVLLAFFWLCVMVRIYIRRSNLLCLRMWNYLQCCSLDFCVARAAQYVVHCTWMSSTIFSNRNIFMGSSDRSARGGAGGGGGSAAVHWHSCTAQNIKS